MQLARSALPFSDHIHGQQEPDLVMIQANAAVSFAAYGMAQASGTGPIASETASVLN
jgi:hypothetical protein